MKYYPKKLYSNTLTEEDMSGLKKNLFTGVIVLAVIGAFVYLVDPTFFGLLNNVDHFSASMLKQGFSASMKQGFSDSKKQGFVGNGAPNAVSNGNATPGQMANPGAANVATDMSNEHVASGNVANKELVQGFQNLNDYEGPAQFGSDSASGPAGCYPRDQLTPSELLPKDQNSVWAEQNPMGPGSLKGKNFLSAGALIGVNTVGQSLRNANYQLRSEPPNPQVAVSIFNQSTIQPDVNRRPLEIS
jgi:hypothetical protein